MFQDLRYGVRMLLKNKGFTVVACSRSALGIGANTAIFSVVQTVLLRPLPFAEQEQLVKLWKQDTVSGTPFVELSLAEVRDWDQQSRVFRVWPRSGHGVWLRLCPDRQGRRRAA